MTRQSLEQQFDDARSSESPFEALYVIAKSLRDIGISQVELYRIFSELFHKHHDDEHTAFFDTITDVLDCIWSGQGKDLELFDTPLTDARVRNVTVELHEPSADCGNWQLAIHHPSLDLQFEIEHPKICREFVDFLINHLNKRVSAELKLGTLGNGAVAVMKDSEYPNQFSLRVDCDRGAVRYTLNESELGQYIGALTQVVDSLAKAT